MLSLIIAPSGFGKTKRVISEIKDILNSEQDRKIYVIVPEQESVKMEGELLSECGNRINKSVEVLNFSRLANRVFREAGGMTYKYIDNCGKDLVVAVALEKLKKSIPFFAEMSDDIKYIEMLRSEMDLLRQKGIHPKDFEQARMTLMAQDRGGESLSSKLSDFSLIFAAYEKALKEGTTDSTDDIVRLAETLDDYDFFDNSYVFLDGFYDYTVPQYDIIERIIKSARKTTVTFSLSTSDPDQVFRKTRLAYNKIRELAEKNAVEYEKIELTDNIRVSNPAIRYLAYGIMQGTLDKIDGEVDGVDVTGVATPYDECVYVAREIVKLVKNGASFSDIAVVSASISEYGSMLENVLEAYGVSFLSCTETSVVTEPVVSLVLTALDTVNSGFFHKNIKTYLKSPYIGLSDKEAYLLENYVDLWAIKFKAWQSEEDWILHPRGYVETFSDSDKEELDVVNTARKKVYAPLKRLSEGLSEPLVENKVRAIMGFLHDLGVYENIGEDENERSAWNMLLRSFDDIVNGAGDMKISRSKFIGYLRLVLSELSFGKIPSSLDEVELGNVGFVRNKNIKHLYFIGFNDGVFPNVNERKSVFTETEKKWLSDLNISIEDSAEDRMHDEVFLFLLAILTPSEGLHFVYHTSSSESVGAKAIPSYFYSYVRDLLGCEIKSFNADKALPVTKKELEGFLLKNEEDEVLELIEKEYPDFYNELCELRRFVDCKDKLFKIENADDFIKNNYSMTQSRLDKFVTCRFSYFLDYMLKARTRKPARFSHAEIGSYVHKILEIVLKEITLNGSGIKNATDDEIRAVAEKTAEEHILSIAPDIAADSPKYKYLIDNIASFAIYVVENIKEEFKASLFEPKYFEENLGDSENVNPYKVTLSDGGTLTFYGVIDRVDTYVDENGVEYIRVVDYKTKSGGKTFSLEDVINGMNIQMLIYLFAMTSTPSVHERRAAGIMYMPAGKSDLKATDEEIDDNSVKKIIDEDLKRSGMYLDDRRILDAIESGEEKRFVDLKYDKKTESYKGSASLTLVQLESFGIIERYINSLFESVITTLKKGDIAPQSLDEGNNKTSCDWCSYKSICRYDGEVKKRIKEKHPLQYMEDTLKNK